MLPSECRAVGSLVYLYHQRADGRWGHDGEPYATASSLLTAERIALAMNAVRPWGNDALRGRGVELARGK